MRHDKPDLSSRKVHLPSQPIPTFRTRNAYVNSIAASSFIFTPQCSATVLWTLAVFTGATTVQLLLDSVPISAPIPVAAGQVMRFAGCLIPNNSRLSFSLTVATTVNFEVAWIKDFFPEYISHDTVLFAGSSGSSSTVTANQGTALALAKWSVSIDQTITLPISAAALPLPTGAATDASLTNGTARASVKLLDSGGVNQLSISAAGAAKVDGSAVTQPISAAALPLPAGAATDASVTNGTLRGTITQGPALALAKWSHQIDSPIDTGKNVLVSTEGLKATYRIANSGVAVVAGLGVSLYGSASKTVKITKMRATMTAATAALGAVVINKYSTAPTGGTKTSPAMVPVDSTDAAATATNNNQYTAAPVQGTGLGAVDSYRGLMPSATVAGNFNYEWNANSQGPKPIKLIGITQGIGMFIAVAGTLDYMIEFTEE